MSNDSITILVILTRQFLDIDEKVFRRSAKGLKKFSPSIDYNKLHAEVCELYGKYGEISDEVKNHVDVYIIYKTYEQTILGLMEITLGLYENSKKPFSVGWKKYRELTDAYEGNKWALLKMLEEVQKGSVVGFG